MWVKFVVGGQVISEVDASSDAFAVKAAEELAAEHGTVEVWTAKFVVVKAVKYDCLDYGKYKQDETDYGKELAAQYHPDKPTGSHEKMTQEYRGLARSKSATK